MIVQCGTCKYWEPKAADRTIGICRRHAPIAIPVLIVPGYSLSTAFPSTKSSDMCGDYVTMDKVPAAVPAAILQGPKP